MGFAPSSRIEAQIYAKHALKINPNARFAILYQNGDLGKDYVAGVRDVLVDKFDSSAKAISYEPTEPTIDSQVVALREWSGRPDYGCDLKVRCTGHSESP